MKKEEGFCEKIAKCDVGGSGVQSYITRWKATFCQRGLLVPVYLCVKVNAEIVENATIVECFRPFIL